MSSEGSLHKFWSTQPVPQLAPESDSEIGPLQPKRKDIRAEPYPLPEAFTWVTLDTSDEAQLAELETLLSENYVEDADARFRFDYSADFIRWSLQPPHTPKDWVVGVRAVASGKLVACITGVAANMRMGTAEVVKTAEINFLCIHKKLRAKRLAPVLIKEVTRRVNLSGVWQAVYTAGVTIPRPVSVARYWHRTLNVKKLSDIDFAPIPHDVSVSAVTKSLRLPGSPQLGMKPMEPRHARQVHRLLQERQAELSFYQVFTVEEIAHLLLPKAGVVYTYVKEDAGNKVTDFFSFYSLPSSVLRLPGDVKLRTVYSYYSAFTSVSKLSLMQESLIYARDLGFDVFNDLEVLDNSEVFPTLKFGKGDGCLNYYAYNWKMPAIPPSQLGLILV